MNPPAAVEALLRGFVTDRADEEELLGDLMQEWHERRAQHGRAAADAWYRRQAAWAIPHLVWHSAARGPVRVLNTVLAALLTTTVLAGFWQVAVLVVAGSPADVAATRPLVVVSLLTSAASALVVGSLVGWSTRHQHLVGATWAALAWIPVAPWFSPAPDHPAWYHVALPAALSIATVAGGWLGTTARRRRGQPATA